jgi:hypothetical protein
MTENRKIEPPFSLNKMKRRDFLKALVAGVVVGGLAPSRVLAEIENFAPVTRLQNCDHCIKDYLHKMQNFDKPHAKDVYLDRKQYRLLKSCVQRLKRLQQTVGYGNFHLLSFDDTIKVAHDYSRVGRFSKEELDFMEMIFYYDPALYGFLGKKPVKNLCARIDRKKVVKVPHSGNHLYKGFPLEIYRQIKLELGDQVILTSGVRSIVKQFLLFLHKAYMSNGNLSLASRSLAPPGYSFHGISDFDVGQAGFGAANFTDRFVTTEVYGKLKDLDYLQLRYPQSNMTGVRFEPWHIKVNSKA